MGRKIFKTSYLQFFTHNTAPLPLPPPKSMLLKPKNIKPDEKWDTTLNRGRGDCRLLKFKGFVASVPRLLKLIICKAMKSIFN